MMTQSYYIIIKSRYIDFDIINLWVKDFADSCDCIKDLNDS